MNEEKVVACLASWLRTQGWNVLRARHRGPGFDIEAESRGGRWFIEAKGDALGDRPNQVLNFETALGQIVRHGQDPEAKYSVAFPDIPHYRNLWQNARPVGRSPIASCLFVSANQVEECF